MLKKYKLKNGDVILDIEENGKSFGINVNVGYDTYHYYWGATGCSPEMFLQDVNFSYFAGCLMNSESRYSFCIKSTMTNVRKSIKSEAGWRFYYDLDFDKELRRELRSIEGLASCEQSFVDYMGKLRNTFYYDAKHNSHIDSVISYISSEPWFFIVKNESFQTKRLGRLFKELQNKLEKEECADLSIS